MLKLIFKKPVGFLVFSLLLCILGVWMASRLPVMMYPQTRRPMVTVRFSHPGISAIDFQQNYSDSIETRLKAIDGVELMETSYSSDSSSVSLTFSWKTKSADAKSSVEGVMQSVNSSLPSDLRDSYSIRFREGENAGYIVMGASSVSETPEKLMEMLTKNVEPKLRTIEDIEEISLSGLEELRVNVTLNQLSMLTYGININDVNTAFQAGLAAQPLGTLRDASTRYSVRYSKSDKSLARLPSIEIKRIGNTIVSLEDIADIDIRYSLPVRIFLIENDPAIQAMLSPIDGGNLNRMTEDLLKIMEEARASGKIPEDTRFELYVDPAKYINRSIGQVIKAALIGGALAIIIVFLILGEPRNTLIIATSIPISILLSFILMKLFGVSLNLISLGGFALAVGMIVDSTIVVMENIHRWRRQDKSDLNQRMWRQLVMDATRQVRAPVISSTLTSVLVFLPLSFSAPLANAILGEQAKTVVFALLCSLYVSLSIVPMVAFYLFLGRGKTGSGKPGPRGFARISEPVMDRITGAYRKILAVLIRKPANSAMFLLLVTVAMGLAVYVLLPKIPKEIMSKPQSDRVVLFFSHNDYTETEDIIKVLMPELNKKLAASLAGLPHKSYSSISGRFNQLLIDFEGPEYVNEAINRLEKTFLSEGPWYFNIQSWDPAALPLPMVNSMQISVYGPDPTVKAGILDNMQRTLNESRIYNRVNVRPSPSMSNELIFTPREETLRGFGSLNITSINSLVRRILGGSSSIAMTDGVTEVNVSARYPSTEIDSIEKLENFLIPWNNAYVPLKHFVDMSVNSSVSQIYSENGELVFRLYANLGPDTPDSVRIAKEKEAKALLEEKLELPNGYSYTFDNPRVEIDNAIESLYSTMLVSVLLIYLLLCFQFNSLLLPLVILVTIPLGFVGVVISLFLFKSTLNLNSMLGTILLGGIVVNNAIIMIDFYINTRKDYKDHRAAIEDMAALRFQPILITSLTTIIGMLPIAMGTDSGSAILQPLGIAVAGGLFVSTLFALFAVPAILSFWRYEA